MSEELKMQLDRIEMKLDTLLLGQPRQTISVGAVYPQNIMLCNCTTPQPFNVAAGMNHCTLCGRLIPQVLTLTTTHP